MKGYNICQDTQSGQQLNTKKLLLMQQEELHFKNFQEK